MLVASSLRLLFIWLFLAPILDEICIHEIIIDTLTSVGHCATYDFVVLALDILIRLLTDRWPGESMNILIGSFVIQMMSYIFKKYSDFGNRYIKVLSKE